MKSNVTKWILFLFLISVSVACNSKKAEPVATVIDKEQIKREIQAIEDKFSLIYTHRNADSLTYYADDAVSYFVGQEPLVGKAAIHKFIADELKDFPEGIKIINTTLEVYVFEDGNNVGEIGEYKRVDSTGKVLQAGHYFSFFAKRNGRYVCTRDMATALPQSE
jgi:ketosteroid isomerase-like protein